MIKQTIEKQALANIITKKEHAEYEVNKKLIEAYSKTNYKQEFNTLRFLEFELAKLEYTKSDTKKQLAKIAKQQQIIEKELAKVGLTSANLTPKYECKLCNDTGVVNGKYCTCFEKEKNKLYFELNNINISNLPSFNDFKFELYDTEILPYVKKVYEICNGFIDKFNESNKQILLLIGNTGIGKTFISECILQKALNKNIYTIFTTAFKLNNDLLKYHLANIEDKQKIIEPYLTCELLIIDDLGTETKLKNVTLEYLYLIISERTKNGAKTIFTTNLNKDMLLDRYENRIYSRLFNKRVSVELEIPSTDLRTKDYTIKLQKELQFKKDAVLFLFLKTL